MRPASTFAMPSYAPTGRHRPGRVCGWSGQPGHRAADGEPGLPRLLRDNPAGIDLAAHNDTFGPASFRGQALIEQAAAAGLTGRGGGAFPMARKLATVAAAGRGAVAVANGAEGEPASSKDAALLWYSPHLVLDGLQLAAEAAGASSAFLYVHAARHSGPDLVGRLRAALDLRAAAGIDRIDVQLAEAPARFLAGEESALVARLNGGAARPGYKQPRVFERGVAGRPTLVQNVETLAHLAMIARYGAVWFRGVGTTGEPGSMLCTVRDPDGRVRIVEAAIGTPLRHLVWLGDDVQAVLAGGYHGGWLSVAQARQLALSNASLRPAGAMTGAGILIALPTGRCGLTEVAEVTRYLALESAGQCGPCFNGLPAIAVAFGTVARPRPAERELANLRRWAGLVTGRGACHHPDGTARFVASALDVFAAEVAEHGRGRCTGTQAGQFLPVGAATLTESDWS